MIHEISSPLYSQIHAFQNQALNTCQKNTNCQIGWSDGQAGKGTRYVTVNFSSDRIPTLNSNSNPEVKGNSFFCENGSDVTCTRAERDVVTEWRNVYSSRKSYQQQPQSKQTQL